MMQTLFFKTFTMIAVKSVVFVLLFQIRLTKTAKFELYLRCQMPKTN